MLGLGFFVCNCFLQLWACTVPSALCHLPATCRGRSGVCLTSGRCTAPGSNLPHRTAHMSWDSLAAFASPQSSTPREQNILVSSSGVKVGQSTTPWLPLSFRCSLRSSEGRDQCLPLVRKTAMRSILSVPQAEQTK